MQLTRVSGRWRRALKRLAAVAAVLVPLGVVSVVVAGPAEATVCRTNAHVYLTSVYPASYRFENQPLDGGTDDYQMYAGDWTSLRVGGNGLLPYTSAFWNVQSNVSGQFSFNSRVAGSNCVANETYVNLARHTVAGEVWTVKANYLTGNSGQFIQNQAHFRIFFVDPPPPDPYAGCYYAEACF